MAPSLLVIGGLGMVMVLVAVQYRRAPTARVRAWWVLAQFVLGVLLFTYLVVTDPANAVHTTQLYSIQQ